MTIDGLEIALIAGASAVAGSLITGGLAYLGMRHQTKHDRSMRVMEARIRAYADLVAVAFDTVTELSLSRAPWRGEPLRQRTVALVARATSAIGEVRLLATKPVIEAATELMDAVDDAATFAFKVLKDAAEKPPLAKLMRPDPVPVPSAPGQEEVLRKLGESAASFVEEAKRELGLR